MESDSQRNGAQLLADLLEISLESLKNCLPYTPVSADRQHAGTGFEWISLGNPVRARLRGDYERLIVASPNDRSGPFVMNAGSAIERLRTDEVGDLMWLSATLAEAGISFQ